MQCINASLIQSVAMCEILKIRKECSRTCDSVSSNFIKAMTHATASTITRIHKIIHSHSFTRRSCRPHQLRNSQCEYPTTRRIPYTKFISTVANASSRSKRMRQMQILVVQSEFTAFCKPRCDSFDWRASNRIARCTVAGSQLSTSYRTYSNGIITFMRELGAVGWSLYSLSFRAFVSSVP